MVGIFRVRNDMYGMEYAVNRHVPIPCRIVKGLEAMICRRNATIPDQVPT